MKINTPVNLFFVLLLTISSGSFLSAQSTQINKANEKYAQLEYIDALKIYEKVAERGYGSEEIYLKLGNAYYFNAQYDKAAKWYEKLFQLNSEPKNIALFLRYSQALRAIGSSASAQTYFDEYLRRNPQAAPKENAFDYLEAIKQNSDRYNLQKLEAIYDPSNIVFGSRKENNKLIYASTHETKGLFNRKSAWDGLNFLSLYEVALDKDNNVVGKPKKFDGKTKSKYHESSLIYTKDQKTIYYTANNSAPDEKSGNQNLKIFRLKNNDGKWSKPEELAINSDHFSTAHPAFSPDEKTLYFASNRPGGFGESDIYTVSIDEDGNLGSPINLGPKVNTSGKDTFPFVSADNELYFSSDGHFGLGGLDVFYVDLKEEGFGDLLNIGEPVNSYADDFAFAIDTETKRGFISSNRSDAVGHFIHSNIFTFLETEPIKNQFMGVIHGTVTDIKTGEPIENVIISLTDKDGKLIKETPTDSIGNYSVEVNKTESYFVKATHDNYDTEEKQSQANLQEQQIDFQLQPNKVAISEGTDLAKVLNIPLIYFDYNKWNIRPDAKVELEKIYIALNEYPKLRINIRAHTDSRGSDSYNKKLSECRAGASLDYLISQGINRSRLESEGLGESELINHCADDVSCSEEEHQKNRRSEFLIKE